MTKNTQTTQRETDDQAVAELRYVGTNEAHNWLGGAGWYWWEQEYPEEGVCGPYPTMSAAIADMSTDHVLHET